MERDTRVKLVYGGLQPTAFIGRNLAQYRQMESNHPCLRRQVYSLRAHLGLTGGVIDGIRTRKNWTHNPAR